MRSRRGGHPRPLALPAVMTLSRTAVILAALLALTGCSGASDEDTTADESGATLPDCTSTWETGAALPDPYGGCDDDGETVAPKFLDCTNGNGRYVQWDGGVAYAREGAPVIDRAGQLAIIRDPGNEAGAYATPTPTDDFTRG